MQDLFLFRRQMADSSFELGAFSFPAVEKTELAVLANQNLCFSDPSANPAPQEAFTK